MNYLVVLISILIMSFSSPGQESKYKALFIYKFLQNMEWPAEKISDKYKVAVLNDTELMTQLESLTEGRNINGKPIEVVSFSKGQTLTDINILFIPSSQPSQFEVYNEEAVSNSVVLITESEGYASKGASINFVIEGSRLKFEMNMSSMESTGVEVSSSIKSLAILVD